VGAILFAAGTTNSYNITGTATLTLGSAAANGITDASATDQTISVSNITEAVNQTWSVTGAGNLSISSNVATGPLTLTLDGSSTGTGTISGIISGTSSTTIVKNGTGTWILSGAETYVGATMVNAGTLLFDGTTPAGGGDFTVNSGGTLGGTGVIGGTTSNTPRVIVNAGGNLAPGDGGNTTGILTSNSLRLMPGSNFLVDINGTVVGTGYDQYRITASGASSGVAQFAGSNLVVNVGAATLTPGDTFTILIRTNPSGNITLSDTFAGLPNSTLFTATNGWIFRINYNVQPRGGTLF
jgi:autotransporter-associated beta strand protein